LSFLYVNFRNEEIDCEHIANARIILGSVNAESLYHSGKIEESRQANRYQAR
jgi:hypothetical protein